MSDRPEIVLSDLIRRVGLLEIELHGSGDLVSRLLQGLQHEVEASCVSHEALNDLENRVLLLEERSRPCPETQKLKELATLLVRLPGGLWAPVYCLIAVDTLIALAIEVMGPTVMIRNFLGL